MVVCYNKTVKEKNMEYFAHTRDDGGKRFWKKYTTRRNVCSAIWSPAKGKEHIVTATLGEDGQVHLYDPQNNKCDKIMIKERGKNGKKSK